MNPQQLTEYLTRVIQPRFATVDGVADAADPRRRRNSPCASGSIRWPWPRARSRRPTSSPRSSVELPVGARQHQERVLRLFDRGEDDAAGSADLRRAADPRQRRQTSCACATWRGSSSPPPRPTRASASTARTASSSASSRRRRPTRSTSRPACARSCARIQTDLPEGMQITLLYDSTEAISASIEEVLQDDRRGGGHRRPRHPALPRLVPLGRHPDRHHPAVADRRLLPDVGARLFAEHADAAGHGAGHRPRRRRRDRGGGEHPPPHRGGPHAAGGRDRGHARDHLGASSP